MLDEVIEELLPLDPPATLIRLREILALILPEEIGHPREGLVVRGQRQGKVRLLDFELAFGAQRF